MPNPLSCQINYSPKRTPDAYQADRLSKGGNKSSNNVNPILADTGKADWLMTTEYTGQSDSH